MSCRSIMDGCTTLHGIVLQTLFPSYCSGDIRWGKRIEGHLVHHPENICTGTLVGVESAVGICTRRDSLLAWTTNLWSMYACCHALQKHFLARGTTTCSSCESGSKRGYGSRPGKRLHFLVSSPCPTTSVNTITILRTKDSGR